LPFSPVKFSGLIERDFALERFARESMLEKSGMRYLLLVAGGWLLLLNISQIPELFLHLK